MNPSFYLASPPKHTKMWIVPQNQKGYFEDFKLKLETHSGRYFLIGASTKAHFCWLTVKALKRQVFPGAQPLYSSRSPRLAGDFFFLELAPAVL